MPDYGARGDPSGGRFRKNSVTDKDRLNFKHLSFLLEYHPARASREVATRQQARQADVAEPSAAAEELLDRLMARVGRQRLDVHRALLSHSK